MAGDMERVMTELARAGVRYLVVGGVAVVLHGYLRTTADLDLVVDLRPANVDNALDVLERLGFRPRPPVPLRSFANAEERERWVDEKNLQVFSLWHPAMPGFELDLFVTPPFDFDAALSRAAVVEMEGLSLHVASIDDLIAMKRRAGRARDLEDIGALLALREKNERNT